ncbi:hypothetical protein J6590_023561 [Homalodisca vitripennis]|nr:hypothetical protein J6590_023561 [Homalodisca vitripennis]
MLLRRFRQSSMTLTSLKSVTRSQLYAGSVVQKLRTKLTQMVVPSINSLIKVRKFYPAIKTESSEDLTGVEMQPSVSMVERNLGLLLQCEEHG